MEVEPFTCPRCKNTAEARFYGPCGSCVEELRATVGSAPQTAVEVEAYEPKMNVTPNAVALKDD